MNRRTFLTGLAATAAGILVPQAVAAEPERRIWALDRTMVRNPNAIYYVDPLDANRVFLSNVAGWNTGDFCVVEDEWMLVTDVQPTHLRVIRNVRPPIVSSRRVLDSL